jgi:hypothetical protein
MTKRTIISLHQLNTLLNLPDGTELVAIRQTDHGQLELTITDPTNTLPPDATYNDKTKTWEPYNPTTTTLTP